MGEQLLQQILASLVPSAFAAWLAVRLSIRQFHSQRWWEKKATTYASILEHLSELQFALGEFYDDWVGVRDIGRADSEHVKQLQVMSRGGRVAVGKAAALGSFIVSAQTARVLEKLQETLQTEEGGDPSVDLEAHYYSLKHAIPEIRKEAKKDLGVD